MMSHFQYFARLVEWLIILQGLILLWKVFKRLVLIMIFRLGRGFSQMGGNFEVRSVRKKVSFHM